MKTIALYFLSPIWMAILAIAMVVLGIFAAIWFFCFIVVGIFGALANGYYD